LIAHEQTESEKSAEDIHEFLTDVE